MIARTGWAGSSLIFGPRFELTEEEDALIKKYQVRLCSSSSQTHSHTLPGEELAKSQTIEKAFNLPFVQTSFTTIESDSG
jgi:hypothetical protein